MEDDVLNLCLCLMCHVPSVVLGIDGVRGVVVQVVEHAVPSVVAEHVQSGTADAVGAVGLSEADVAAPYDGHSPEVASDGVA